MGNTTKILVGLLLIGALIIFAVGTFYIKDWGLQLRKGYEVTARFKSAENLADGDNVTISGVKVGKVKQMDIDSTAGAEYPVIATFWVRGDVKLRADDQPEIRTESVFGGKYVAIVRGDPKANQLADGSQLRNGVVTPDIPEVIAEMKSTLARTHKAIDNITEITDRLKEGKGTIGKLLTDEAAYNELTSAAKDAKAAFKNIDDLTNEIRNGKGLATTILKDEELAKDVKSMAKDISTVAKDAQGVVGDAKAFMKDLREITRDMKDGKGTIGKLLKSDELYKDVKSLAEQASSGMKSLQDVADKISKGEGTVGKLVNSDDAYKSLMASLDNVKKITADFADAKGTLPKLIHDDKLYVQLERAVKGLQEAIQDYREQSPIVTFTGVVFGAF